MKIIPHREGVSQDLSDQECFRRGFISGPFHHLDRYHVMMNRFKDRDTETQRIASELAVHIINESL